MTRLLIPVAALLMALTPLVGCGNSTDADLTEDSTAEELLDRSIAALTEQRSYRLSVEAAIETGSATLDDGSPIDLLGALGSFTAEGAVVDSDLALEMRANVGSFHVDATLTRLDARLYVEVVGRSFEIVDDGGVGDADLSGLPHTLLSWIEGPREVDRRSVGGVETVQIQAGIDPDAINDDLAALLGGDRLSARGRRRLVDQLRSGSVSVWIGRSDLLPRRLAVGLTLTGRIDDIDLTGVEIGTTFNLSDYGVAATISAPPDSGPLAVDELTRMMRR